jgi:hypothetical protein
VRHKNIRRSFASCSSRLAESNAFACPVFFDELDPRRFKPLPSSRLVCGCNWNLSLKHLKNAATSSAARTPGSSWAMMKVPSSGLEGKRGEVEPEDLSGNLLVQLGLATRGPEPTLVSGQHGPGPHRHPAANPTPGAALDAGNAGNSCCSGRSQRKQPLRSTWLSCNTICGLLRRETRCSR